MTPVFRFAPSPTGLLHLGHAYSALFTWAEAAAAGGRCLLRIEDIDLGRCRPEFETAITEDLAWLGLRWETPVRRQSAHMDDYRAALDRLAAIDLLYPCFCTRKEIQAEIAAAPGAPHGPDGPLYPGTCTRLSEDERQARLDAGDAFALRLHMGRAAALSGPLSFTDAQAGTVAVDPAGCGDVVLARKGVIHGWRGELYAVKNAWESSPMLLAERALMPYFGFRSYGVHVNGYVRRPDGLYLWVARRSEDRPNFPGLLDNTVAGGQPHGLGLIENVIKECAEEAALSRAVAGMARPVGYLTYNEQPDPVRVKPDRLYCYDLEMPDGLVPRNTDGEIVAFFLMRAEDVMALVRETDAFKPNCAVVLIDFFLRHGLLTPDDEPDHAAIVRALNRGD